MRKSLAALVSYFLILQMAPAEAATITATGTNPSICNQTVDNSVGVVAARLSGGDCVVEFQASSSSYVWTAPAGVYKVSYLVVGGGAGGGNGYDNGGGGGGGGGMVLTGSKTILPFTNYSIYIGDGGAGGANARANNEGVTGESSTFSDVTALGGGFGKASRTAPGGNRLGGSAQNTTVSSGVGGNGGGSGGGGGGGGGATGNGVAGSGATRGTGGAGLTSALDGTSTIYGAGGDGAAGNTTSTGASGLANTGKGGGGGGGASSASGAGGKGGSGLVVIRYTLAVATGTNPTVCNQSVDVATNVVVTRISGGDCVVEFKNTGSLNWTVPANITSVWILAVGGGGGGGGDEGGGGGGGGYVEDSTFAVTGLSSISISVGDGGNAGTDDSAKGGNGEDSVFSSLTAKGGGGGGTAANDVAATRNGNSGGSGGGGAGENRTTTGGSSFLAQGFSGGGGSGRFTGYGGGGAGEAGETDLAGYGGDGKASSITGVSVIRAGGGGGGGGNNAAQSAANGGDGGGGRGGGLSSGQVGVSGTNFLGGGGGGGGSGGGTFLGGYAGGSGIVIVRYSPVTDQIITLSSLGTSSKTFPYSQSLSMSTSGSDGTGAITYAIASGGTATGCALSDSTENATITASTSGTCLLRATIAADLYYNSASSGTLTFTFSKASQAAIVITSTSTRVGIDLTLTSSGGSTGGVYIYTKVSGSCTISGETLTPIASGSCLIQSTLASTVNYLVETSTVTTITIASSNVSASITLQAGTLVYRQTKTITAVTTVAGKVTFKANGKRLAGCVSKTASLQNSFTVTCSYKPATRGYVTITTLLNPTDPTYIGDTSFTERLFIYNRSGTR